jgi:hypothetical protein
MLTIVDQPVRRPKRLLIDGRLINRVMTGGQRRIDGLSPTANNP